MSSSLDTGLRVEGLLFSRIKEGTDRHMIRLLATSQWKVGRHALLGSYFPSSLTAGALGTSSYCFYPIVPRPAVHKASPNLVLVCLLARPWIQEEAAASLANLTHPRVCTEDP